MFKKLIINADDFGYDVDATAAILELLGKQKITSTTIMANLARDKDLKTLKNIIGISTGIHVNLNSGRPVCHRNEVRSLVDKRGKFFDSSKLLTRFVLGKIKIGEIEKEITAQIERLREMGIKISHADSHQHIHQFPFLGKVILDILAKQQITKVRNCRLTSTTSKRANIIQLFSKLTNRHLKQFHVTDGLIPDFSFAGNYDLGFFEKLIDKSFNENNILEIMTHPGIKDRRNSYLNREKEYKFWKNEHLSELLLKKHVQLINYHQLG
jgi:predicted glycoside hydrolase/deacetylase ChbG (UPF0249 family)